MLRKCIEVVRLRRGGEFHIRNLSGTASAKLKFTPVSKQTKALRRVFVLFKFKTYKIVLRMKGNGKNGFQFERGCRQNQRPA